MRSKDLKARKCTAEVFELFIVKNDPKSGCFYFKFFLMRIEYEDLLF